MKNEKSNEEPLINETESSAKKLASKEKRVSMLKQLDNKKLYPVRERVGIYAIAVLSTIGLVLIGYTGVMAIASNADPVAKSLVIEADEVQELLDEIDLENPADVEEPEVEYFESNHEYAETEEEDEGETSTPTTATINAEFVALRREAASQDRIGQLHAGYVVDVIDIESDPFWARVSYDGIVGYVDIGFIDFN